MSQFLVLTPTVKLNQEAIEMELGIFLDWTDGRLTEEVSSDQNDRSDTHSQEDV